MAIALNLATYPLEIILNALLITAIRRNRRLQTMHNILLASMAGTDLMVGVAAQLVFIAQETFHMTEGSLLIYCTITEIAVVMVNGLFTVSLLHLDLISVDKIFITIRKYRDEVSCSRTSCISLAFFISSLCNQYVWYKSIFTLSSNCNCKFFSYHQQPRLCLFSLSSTHDSDLIWTSFLIGHENVSERMKSMENNHHCHRRRCCVVFARVSSCFWWY